MSDKTIEMPNIEDEQLLNEVMEDSVDEVSIKGSKKKYRIGWMKKGTMRKISSVALEKGEDDTLSAKTAALIILNNYWKIKFFLIPEVSLNWERSLLSKNTSLR